MISLLRFAGLVLASLVFFSCSSLPFMGPGSMDLTAKGVELDGVVSIYLIVGDEGDLADLDSEKTIEKLVHPDRQKKYLTFGQFKPIAPKAGEAWRLEQRLLNPNNKDIEVALAKKAPNLEVEIQRKLLKSQPGVAAVLLINCGSKGWAASQKITKFEIESLGKLELEVRGTAINKVGSSK